MKTILTTAILLFTLVGFGQSKPDSAHTAKNYAYQLNHIKGNDTAKLQVFDPSGNEVPFDKLPDSTRRRIVDDMNKRLTKGTTHFAYRRGQRTNPNSTRTIQMYDSNEDSVIANGLRDSTRTLMIGDSRTVFESGTRLMPFYTHSKKDTITVLTYCINIHTLRPKWFRLKAIYGDNYGWVTVNSVVLYKKYLNVPKGYKAVYSIQ